MYKLLAFLMMVAITAVVVTSEANGGSHAHRAAAAGQGHTNATAAAPPTATTARRRRCDRDYSGRCLRRTSATTTAPAAAATGPATSAAPSASWDTTATGSTPTATASPASRSRRGTPPAPTPPPAPGRSYGRPNAVTHSPVTGFTGRFRSTGYHSLCSRIRAFSSSRFARLRPRRHVRAPGAGESGGIALEARAQLPPLLAQAPPRPPDPGVDLDRPLHPARRVVRARQVRLGRALREPRTLRQRSPDARQVPGALPQQALGRGSRSRSLTASTVGRGRLAFRPTATEGERTRHDRRRHRRRPPAPPSARTARASRTCRRATSARPPPRPRIERAQTDPADVGHVVFGNVIHTEPGDMYMARVVGMKAGIPQETPAYTVNRLCGTGVQAIVSAAQTIQTGEASIALAGGAESMCRGPYWMRGARWGARMGDAPLTDAGRRRAHRPVRQRPHGHHRRAPRRARLDRPRAPGRVRRRVAPPRRGRPRGGPLRRPDRPGRGAGQARDRRRSTRDEHIREEIDAAAMGEAHAPPSSPTAPSPPATPPA